MKQKKRVEEFLNKYQEEDKIPAIDAQNWCRDNLGLPPRTFQWYMTGKLIPQPKIVKGRNHFYTQKDFMSLLEYIRIVRVLKTSTRIRFKSLRKILNNSKDRRKVLDLLLNMIDEYPIYDHPETGEMPYYNVVNDLVWSKTIDKLEKELKPDSINLIDFEEEAIKATEV